MASNCIVDVEIIWRRCSIAAASAVAAIAAVLQLHSTQSGRCFVDEILIDWTTDRHSLVVDVNKICRLVKIVKCNLNVDFNVFRVAFHFLLIFN